MAAAIQRFVLGSSRGVFPESLDSSSGKLRTGLGIYSVEGPNDSLEMTLIYVEPFRIDRKGPAHPRHFEPLKGVRNP